MDEFTLGHLAAWLCINLRAPVRSDAYWAAKSLMIAEYTRAPEKWAGCLWPELAEAVGLTVDGRYIHVSWKEME
jgi:hypothetical protein